MVDFVQLNPNENMANGVRVRERRFGGLVSNRLNSPSFTTRPFSFICMSMVTNHKQQKKKERKKIIINKITSKPFFFIYNIYNMMWFKILIEH